MSESHYEGKLQELSERLFEGIKYANKKYGTEHAYVGLMTRDASFGNIDIMHNFTDERDLICILELSLAQLKGEENVKY